MLHALVSLQMTRSVCWRMASLKALSAAMRCLTLSTLRFNLQPSSMHAYSLLSTARIVVIVAQRLLAGHLSDLMLGGEHIWQCRGMPAGLQHILHNSLAEWGNMAGHILQVWHSPFPALDMLCGALPRGNQIAVEPQKPPVEDQCQKQGHRGHQQPAIHLQAAIRASVDAESSGGICKGPGNQQPLEQQVPPESAAECKQSGSSATALAYGGQALAQQTPTLGCCTRRQLALEQQALADKNWQQSIC